ncbi:MAGUK p55 subfamily member 2-like isoform X2 [Bolinopsis microptera]|uniref:MAGUK p55 subfamily member 2-like isoform X2 n=1 Tax=Bolinopsis microptera TaxID=2820187 RepID=UPI003079B61B
MISRLNYKRSFVSKMEERMQKAKFVCHQTRYINESYFCEEFSGICPQSGVDNKKHKFEFQSQTMPSYFTVNAEIVSHCNLSQDNRESLGNLDSALNCHDYDPKVEEFNGSMENLFIKGFMNFSSVFRVNITVSFPVLDTSVICDIKETEEEDPDLPHSYHLTRKFQIPLIQTVNLINIQEESVGSTEPGDDTPLNTPQQSPHQNTHRKDRRKTCGNPDCFKEACTCKRHVVRRSKSHRLPRHKPPRHGLKQSRSVVLLPGGEEEENEEEETSGLVVVDIENGGGGVTLEVPQFLSSNVESLAPDSDSEDEVTLIADIARSENVVHSEDIHKLGTLLCQELGSAVPAAGERERGRHPRKENEPDQLGWERSRSRETSSSYSERPSDIGTGKRRKNRPSGSDQYEGSPSSSRPVSEVFSISSEYFSRATSSDHIYHDIPDSDGCDSDGDYISAPDQLNYGAVYTPYSGSEPDRTRTRSVPSTSSFHNIISSINDLEEKLGPEKHEDLRFLREILQNNQLSVLHRALKTTGDKAFSQSTPHLGNVQNVNNENKLGGQSSKLAASSYNWEQIKQPAPEEDDDDIVTIRFTKTHEQSLGATIVGDKRTGGILIKRILEESPIAACNKIHPGDELKMINNVPVAGKTVEEVREMLGRLSQDCTITVSSFGAFPEDRESYTAPKSRYFRAFFNYDPKKDTLNPCQDASFSFELGDILEVVNTEDESWWQAKKYGTVHVGLIPSSDQRLRYLNSRATKASTDNLLYTREKSKKSKKKKDFLFTFGTKDHKEPLTYIEVTHVRPSKSKRRPIIITGAKYFGGSCIRNKLLQRYPEKYFLPIKHTTKTDAEGYKHCSKKEFSALIKQRDMIEYTKTGGHYYGTSYESVRDLIINGKICLLDVHPQYLSVLCNGTLRPHVIYVEATTEERIKELKQTDMEELPAPQRKLHGSDIRELRFNSERLLRRYTEFVDTIITLESLSSVVDLIDQVAERIIDHPAWMPRRWLENT